MTPTDKPSQGTPPIAAQICVRCGHGVAQHEWDDETTSSCLANRGSCKCPGFAGGRAAQQPTASEPPVPRTEPLATGQSPEYQDAWRINNELESCKYPHTRVLCLMNWKLEKVPAPSEQEMGASKRWQAMPGTESDNWGIGLEGGKGSVAQMLWEWDVKHIVSLHNAALQSGDNRAGQRDVLADISHWSWKHLDADDHEALREFMAKLATQTSDGERAMAGAREKDLAMLCRRMIHAIRTHTADDCKARNIIPKVMDYLVRNGLQGSPLREEYTEADIPASAPADEPPTITQSQGALPAGTWAAGKARWQTFGAGERDQLAEWMITNSFATGHGDKFTDLLKELSWQVAELRAGESRGLRVADALAKAGLLGNVTMAHVASVVESALSQTEDAK